MCNPTAASDAATIEVLRVQLADVIARLRMLESYVEAQRIIGAGAGFRSQLRVIPGTARRRTKRRASLQLVAGGAR
ncbi:hypothetical protein [Amycolatopsis taiwanensis]|uniref:Uncharacterized protein n=1 Tax=Amycolatopsis taiwanensis TaxID=342230 RepID=A0A9W6QVJ2_9PSEU|nr:hypothetical protein [Amycolatopsis taiwanensis]GLY63720.1 hypothetical protein Atai01_03390 [Amycolatopsis taiwanensis]